MAINNQPNSSLDMAGKICMVTGATSGIGKAIALGLAQMKATVIIGGRDAAKTAEVVNELKAQSNNPMIDYVLADLSSQKAIHQMATTFKARYSRLDVLVNNAGVVYDKRKLSSDRIEMTFAVNVIAPFLLMQLLCNRLQESGTPTSPARIVNLASGLERDGRIEFDNLQGERAYKGLAAYNNSKLALILIGYELAQRLQHKNVTVNSLEPGIVATNLAANSSPLFKLGIKLARPFLLTPSQGAEAPLYMATSPQLAATTGKFFFKKQEKATSKISYDLSTRQRLWQVCQELTQLAFD